MMNGTSPLETFHVQQDVGPNILARIVSNGEDLVQPPVAPSPRVDDRSELGGSVDVSESGFDALDRQGRKQKRQKKEHRVDV